MLKSRELIIILVFCMTLRALSTMAMDAAQLNSLYPQHYYYLKIAFQAMMCVFLVILCLRHFQIDSDQFRKIIGKGRGLKNNLLAGGWGLTLFGFTIGVYAAETWLFAQFNTELAYNFWAFKEIKSNEAHHTSIADFFAAALVGGVLAPFAEEFFFRGLLLRSLRKRMGFILTATLSTIIFLALHPRNLHVFSTLVFSFSLCYIYVISGSLGICCVVHSSFNLTALFVENYLRFSLVRDAEQLGMASSWLPHFLLLTLATAVIAIVVYRYRAIIASAPNVVLT